MVGTDDNKTRRMRFTCWITMATGTQSEYVILIAFSTVRMVTGTRLNVTLYVQCLSCYHAALECFYMFSQRVKDCLIKINWCIFCLMTSRQN